MKSKNFIIIIIFTVFITLSCKKENIATGTNINISFSADTIILDTLFTEIGSATYYFKVYNNSNKTVKFDEIFLGNKNKSAYRTRIDGQEGNQAFNVQIAANDSMFIFLETTLQKNSQNEPSLIKDSIIFKSGEHTRDIDILSWGQNVKMMKSQNISTQSLNNSTPYLICGNITVDTLQTLTIKEGTKLYFHKNSTLTIKGKLIVNGKTEKPVLFSSDRLEDFYNDIPGQWNGIYFPKGNLGAEITNATIENSSVGLSFNQPNIGSEIKINNSIIRHCLKNGIEITTGNFSLNNLLITNCGQAALSISDGTNGTINHSTIANYYDYGRNSRSLVISNDENTKENNITVTNSIIYGTFPNEIYIDNENSLSSINIDHCIVKTNLESIISPLSITNSINKDPLFYDTKKQYFYLTKDSPARDFGKLNFGNLLPIDLRGKNRTADNKPDVGAYEYFEIP